MFALICGYCIFKIYKFIKSSNVKYIVSINDVYLDITTMATNIFRHDIKIKYYINYIYYNNTKFYIRNVNFENDITDKYNSFIMYVQKSFDCTYSNANTFRAYLYNNNSVYCFNKLFRTNKKNINIYFKIEIISYYFNMAPKYNIKLENDITEYKRDNTDVNTIINNNNHKYCKFSIIELPICYNLIVLQIINKKNNQLFPSELLCYINDNFM